MLNFTPYAFYVIHTVLTQILRHSWLERHLTIFWQKVHFLGQILDYNGQIWSKFELNGTKKTSMEIRTAPFYLRWYVYIPTPKANQVNIIGFWLQKQDEIYDSIFDHIVNLTKGELPQRRHYVHWWKLKIDINSSTRT